MLLHKPRAAVEEPIPCAGLPGISQAKEGTTMKQDGKQMKYPRKGYCFQYLAFQGSLSGPMLSR